MKKKCALFGFLLIFYICSGQAKYGAPEVDPVIIQNKFMDWLKYQDKNIMLSRDFVSLDSTSKKIAKDVFLNELILGNFIPIRLQSEDSLIYYKLFKIEPTSDTSIKATIVASAIEEYEHLKMEGKAFPKFNFTDLNGNIISNETMSGKIIVIKCWYIHCAACVKEFPNVNKLAEKYKDRKDILFISLAEDTPQQLKVFLAKKMLLYSVVPNMKIYMNEILNLNAFPTHFIINKKGTISKVLLNYESLEVALKNEIGEE